MAVQGFLSALATIFAIGVMFDLTKDMTFKMQSLMFAIVLVILSSLAVAGIKEVAGASED